MWEKIINWFKQVFGKKYSETTRKELERNDRFAKNYNDTNGINIEAMICNKMAGVAIYDSQIEVLGDNLRAKELNKVVQTFWKKKARILMSDVLGNGGMFVIPSYRMGRIVEDIVPQNRVVINQSVNGELIDITVLCEIKNVGSKTYYRLTDHTLKDGVYTIRQKATDESGGIVDLSKIQAWADLTPEYSIDGFDRLPIGYFKCPTSPRNMVTEYGVPLVYGQDEVMSDVKLLLDMLLQEFTDKKAFIGADERLFDAEGELPNGIFKKLTGDNSGSAFWEEYSPNIRDEAIINGITFLFELLEYGVGVSRGVLTKVESYGSTATEIKGLMKDTAVLVNNIRQNFEIQLNNVIYGYDALMEHFGITPAGDYTVNYIWDFSWLESTTETFNQLQIGKAEGVISEERLNMWITGNTREQAQEEIASIKANSPTLEQIGV